MYPGSEDTTDPPSFHHSVDPTSPISSLPNELLVAIFECAYAKRQFYCSDTDLPIEIRLSHVSQKWRHIAIDLPRLWTNIYIVAGFTLDSISEYLDRSKSNRLDLWLRLWEMDETYDAEAREGIIDHTLGLLIPHVCRWSSLVIEGELEESVYFTLTHLRRLHAPVLRKLRIGFDESMELRDGTNFPSQIFTGGAPLLTSARLDMLRCCWPPLKALTAFDLRQPSRSEVVYSRFLGALTMSETLTRLRVHGGAIYQESWRLFSHSTVHLPALRSLELIRPSHLTSSLLLALSAPRLVSLRLEGIHDVDLYAFFESPQRPPKFPLLQSLTLKAVDLDATLYIHFYRLFPTISHLTVVGTYNFDKLCASLGEGGHTMPPTRSRSLPLESAWPDLRTIVVRSLTAFDGPSGPTHSALSEMVSARIAMGRPIRKLVLDSDLHFVRGIPGLTERVHVEECAHDSDDSDEEF